jgi:hypothetical protein
MVFGVLEGCCIGFWCYALCCFFFPAECLRPFIVAISPLEGAPVISLGQRPSPLTDHFCFSQNTSFPLFHGRNFFRSYFCFFSCSRHIVCMILAYFSRLLSSAISSLFLRNVRTLMEFIEEHDCIKCLGLRRKKTVSWFACTYMVTRIELWLPRYFPNKSFGL